MICLEEKGLKEYQSKQLSFLKAEHKSDEVVDINPRGQVKFRLKNFKTSLFWLGLSIQRSLQCAFKGQGMILLIVLLF